MEHETTTVLPLKRSVVHRHVQESHTKRQLASVVGAYGGAYCFKGSNQRHNDIWLSLCELHSKFTKFHLRENMIVQRHVI